MDQTSSGTPAARSSSSSANRDAAAEGVRVGHDDVMLSAFNRLHLYAPPGTLAANEQARVTSNSRPRGVAGTSPSMVPRSAVGRGRARTLPAWMTAGENAPGGLRQQTPIESDGRARAPQTTGVYSSRPQQSARSAQQVGQNADTSFRLGVQTAKKNKDKKKNHAAGLNASNNMSRPREKYSSPPQHGSTQIRQQASPNNGDNIQSNSMNINNECAPPPGTYHAGGFHVFGGAQPTAAATLGPGSRTMQVKTEIARGLDAAPTPPTTDRSSCAPGVSVAGPAVPATSQPVHPRSAGGRGIGRTFPAWMTSDAGPTVPGGLQQQVPVEDNLSAWVPTLAGLKSSPPQQSANAGQQAFSNNSDKSIQNSIMNSRNEGTPTPAGVGTYHAGGFHVFGSAQPTAAATLGPGNRTKQDKTEIARGLGPTPTPPTADRSNCAPMDGVFVPAPAAPATNPSMHPRMAGEQGLGKKLPAWTTSGVGHTAVPGDLQQQAPVEGNLSAWAPEAAVLKSSPPHENANAGQPTPLNNGAKNKKKKRKPRNMKTLARAVFIKDKPASAQSCNSSRLTEVETVRGAEPAPIPPPTTKSNRKPNNGVMVAGGDMKWTELFKTADMEHTSQLLNQKRSRDEGTTVPLSRSALGGQGAAPEDDVASTVGMVGAVGRVARAESGPRSKKSKASVPDNSPPQVSCSAQER